MDGDWNYVTIWSDVPPYKLHQILLDQIGHHFEMSRLSKYDQWASHEYQKFWLIENQWCNCYKTQDVVAIITIPAQANNYQDYYALYNYSSDSIDYNVVTPEFTNFNNTIDEAKFRITETSNYFRFKAFAKKEGIVYQTEEL